MCVQREGERVNWRGEERRGGSGSVSQREVLMGVLLTDKNQLTFV